MMRYYRDDEEDVKKKQLNILTIIAAATLVVIFFVIIPIQVSNIYHPVYYPCKDPLFPRSYEHLLHLEKKAILQFLGKPDAVKINEGTEVLTYNRSSRFDYVHVFIQGDGRISASALDISSSETEALQRLDKVVNSVLEQGYVRVASGYPGIQAFKYATLYTVSVFYKQNSYGSWDTITDLAQQ